MRDPIDHLRSLDPARRADGTGPPAGMEQRILAERRRRPVPRVRSGWAIALSAAAVVIVFGGAWLLWLGDVFPRQPAVQTTTTATTITPDTTTPPATSGTTPREGEATAPTTTTSVPASTSPIPEPVSGERDLGDAPWLEPPLTVADVPAVLSQQWSAAENHTWCAALFPTETGDLPATVRAEFSSGGWALAWDLPSGPGRGAGDTLGSEYCSDCGTAAFGIVGVGWAAAPPTGERDPATVRWDDGSVAYYQYEGMPPHPVGAPLAANGVLGGQGCAYTVWTFLGEQHLLAMLDSLRTVEGLDAEPVTPITFLTPEPAVMGTAPWATGAIRRSDVPGPLLSAWDTWSTPPDSCPLLVPTAYGTQLDASVRIISSRLDAPSVTWDLPSGAGRPYGADYCSDCGRSAFGYRLSSPADHDLSFDPYPITHTWDDGSYAWILSKGTYYTGGIPDDRLEYRDSATGQPLATRPHVAFLQPAGSDCGYILESYLGRDHLLGLIASLRPVEGT